MKIYPGFYFFFIIPFFSLFALTDYSPPCLRIFEVSFFRNDLVGEALSLHNVSQSAWEPIILALQQRSLTVPDRMRTAAMRLKPNRSIIYGQIFHSLILASSTHNS